MTDLPDRPLGASPRPGASAPGALDRAVDEACRILRGRRISPDALARIAGDGRLQASHEVRLRTVLRPELPLAAGLPLLGGLRWRDLARVMDDVRLFAPLRARAEQLLGERIEEMTSGEKVTLARLATRVLILTLRDARSPSSPQSVLAALARSERWCERRVIRMALAQNPRSASADALRALRGLGARDLRKISENPSAPRLVRIGAARLLTEPPHALH